ncbi:MAG: hypothetical protein QNK05_18480 [Myxococcota bacterium]|nr:hypothetical protein [Myxococcota bacterium]
MLRSLCFLLPSVVLSLPLPSLAMSLARSTGTARCAVQTPVELSGFSQFSRIISLGCDKTNFVVGGFPGQPPQVIVDGTAVVVLNTIHSKEPIADVQAAFVNQVGASGPGRNPRVNEASGSASVEYEYGLVSIQERIGLPSSFRVDMTIVSAWEMNSRGAGSGAAVGIRVFHDAFPDQQNFIDSASISGTDSLEDEFRFSLAVDRSVPVRIVIEATCGVVGSVVEGGTTDCQSVIDPVIRFDQAAFDARMGADTFPLDEFFAIELSANLPEPDPGMLLASGGLLLALSRGVRRRASR